MLISSPYAHAASVPAKHMGLSVVRDTITNCSDLPSEVATAFERALSVSDMSAGLPGDCGSNKVIIAGCQDHKGVIGELLPLVLIFSVGMAGLNDNVPPSPFLAVQLCWCSSKSSA
eukprot:GHRR01021450.1.p1 GENE.GHRR01021450.1~~GHRR01021450.1.p1  ORF type:complete len:116 (-),score=27.88 GHRR01021450.1:122-469(-)